MKLYAVISDSHLLSLHRSEQAAQDAAAVVVVEAQRQLAIREHGLAWQEGETRAELQYRTGRTGRWQRSGVYIDTAELTP